MKTRELEVNENNRPVLFTLFTIILLLTGMPAAHADTVDIDYSLSGGAAFYTASGTAAARITYTVVGFGTHTQLVTGSASGAISWDYSGDLSVQVDDSGTVRTTPTSLNATQRAGSVAFNFPLVDLAGFNLDLDGTVYSADSPMQLELEDGYQLNDTDWSISQNYSLPTGLNGVIAGQTIPYHRLPLFPMLLNLSNDAGFSSASLAPPQGSSVSLGFLNDGFQHDCFEFLGACIVNIDRIDFDFSGVYLTASSLPATGTSQTVLPTIVPLPASVWLMLSGLAGLVVAARYRR